MAPVLVEEHVAVKLVIGNPLLVPAVNGTRIPPPERVTTPIVGALGTVAGMIELDAAELAPVPIALVALTVHEYVSPLVRPFTEIGLAAPLAATGLAAPMSVDEHLALNDEITKPLLLPGLNATDNEPLPLRLATTAVGAFGTAPGVTAFESADAAPEPTSLCAVTVHVYDWPFVRLLTVTGLPDWFGALPGPPEPEELQLTSYWAGRPPSKPGVNATCKDAFPRTATTPVGASGARAGMKLFESGDCGPVPTEDVARTAQVYVFPLSRPATEIGLATPVALRVAPPSLEVHVTAKLVIGEPSSKPGVNVTLALLSPRVATPIVGASGTVSGTTAFVGADSAPVPIALVASIVHV